VINYLSDPVHAIGLEIGGLGMKKKGNYPTVDVEDVRLRILCVKHFPNDRNPTGKLILLPRWEIFCFDDHLTKGIIKRC
jgi:hypothetical protein